MILEHSLSLLSSSHRNFSKFSFRIQTTALHYYKEKLLEEKEKRKGKVRERKKRELTWTGSV